MHHSLDFLHKRNESKVKSLDTHHNVAAQHHLFITQLLRNDGAIVIRIRNTHILRLAAINRVAKAPASHHLASTLRGQALLAMPALPTRSNGADTHTVTDFDRCYTGPAFHNDTDGFMTQGETGLDGVFALPDVDVGAADCGAWRERQEEGLVSSFLSKIAGVMTLTGRLEKHFAKTRLRNRFLDQRNLVLVLEDKSLHFFRNVKLGSRHCEWMLNRRLPC